ncbi:trichohyalin-like isoform X8 [Saccostrea cucullata]|uniref:trichohyalin-like isoform X8 n=1 Tax=Saccostrea cuccullata TaxID=36930 RepID=UPI002ED56021
MNYGLLNFKAQNGKPGIFWTNEQQKKPLKKVDYKTRKQPFEIRHHPKNYDRIEPEVDNILKPLPDDKPKEPEKPKKPAKNFIQKNRERLGKGKKGKEDEKDGTVTLTQEQLNAILASVGKVASGEEEKLKIHIDSEHNEVTIESPRRREHSDDETEKHHRDRSEKENGHSKSRKDRRKKEDDSIYALMGGDTNRSKKDRHRKTEHDYSEERSSHRDRRSHDDSRDRNHSRERYKNYRDRDRNQDRERERHPGYDPDYDRKKKQEDSTERILKDLRQKAEDQLEKSRGNDRLRESKSKENDIRDSKKYESTNHLSPDPNIENISPREIAGIPVSLPWKHMTVAERRRLMIAREKVIAEAEKRKEEGVKSKWREMVKEETEKLETRKKKESRRRSPSYSPPRSRDGSGDRRRDNSRDRRERSRERRRERVSPSDRRESRSRERRRRSPSDDRRESHRERRNSRERSRDDSSDRSRHRSRRRSPSPSNRQEDKTSNTSVATNVSTRPPTNMSLAEKKRLQWERERAESQVGYTPWGKPGAGAPLRTKSGKLAADYRARQEDYPETIDEESHTVNQNSSQNASENNKSRRQRKESEKREEVQRNQQPTVSTSSRNVPAAMRSSFIFGQIAPDADMYETTKEQERQQWLKDLERQREEKREQQIQDYEGTHQGKNTWADKFSNDYRPARLPEQLPETVRREDVDAAADTNRISSAPVNVSQTINDSEDKSYIRGQNVYMDPVTKKELEDSRQRQLEHQRAVMEQVQEKQRQKQLERERKMAEDAEEERKLQAERDRLQRQFEMEQNKLKMREVKRQEEVERLKAAMDEAHEKAMREKYSRKMQHLEQGGHDTSHLKANLAAKITPRGDPNHIVPSQVPGLDLELSPRAIGPPTAQYTQKDSYHEPHYIENRVLTPNKYRQHGHTSEFGTQTGMNAQYQMDTDRDEDTPLESRRALETKREATDVGIMYKLVNGKRVRVKSAPKEELQKNREQREIPRKKAAEKKKDKKLWNYQNKNLKKPIKQSEKDPLYLKKKEESRVRRQQREQRLLEMVEKNRDIIPTERQNRTPGHSREHSPFSEGGRTPRSTVKEYSAYSVRRARSHSPDRSDSRTATRTLERTDSPPNRKSPVSHHSISPVPTGRRSPPIPALRNRNTDRNSNYLAIDYDASGIGTRVVNSKYNDGDPLEIPVGNSDFVPFLRTVDILDPAKASSPMPLSREATQVANARKAYIKGMKPGNYGNRVDTYQDRMRLPNERRQKDPILNPSLVTDHPTQRQDAILQQLSTMRENLMQRQRELETFSPTDLE